MKPSKDSKKYKFDRVQLRIRWVDYEKIRHIFPPMENESCANYFMRFAIWLQEENRRKDK